MALRHNTTFDGAVPSIAFERNGRRMTAFEVPGGAGFDARADEPAAYLCEFL